jgi:anti-sigma B factor antagonist
VTVLRDRAGSEITPALGFDIETNFTEDGVAEITVAGKLDRVTSLILREVVNVCGSHDGVVTLIVDVGELSFIDATGLSAMWSAREMMHASGGEVYLRKPNEAVKRMLKATKLDCTFAILDKGD